MQDKLRTRHFCVDCPDARKLQPAFPDAEGRGQQLCAAHARERGCYILRRHQARCRECTLQANYADVDGTKYVFCAEHAKIAGSYVKRQSNPLCRDCPSDKKITASYPDEEGNGKKLCFYHAEIAKTRTMVVKPCSMCPENAKLSACCKDAMGHKTLCASHARIIGTYMLPQPCKLCASNNKVSAKYKDENGAVTLCAQHAETSTCTSVCEKCSVKTLGQFPNLAGEAKKLCTLHAKVEGTYKMERPCKICPSEKKIRATFKDTDGNITLCSAHAYELHLSPKPKLGFSKEACCVWDRLEIELGIVLQHAHFSLSKASGPLISDEYQIPGTRFRVDAYDHKHKVIYEYLGEAWHGVPPTSPIFYHYSKLTKKTHAEMYLQTMDRMRHISRLTGSRVRFVWGSHYRKVKKNVHPLISIVRNLEDEDADVCIIPRLSLSIHKQTTTTPSAIAEPCNRQTYVPSVTISTTVHKRARSPLSNGRMLPQLTDNPAPSDQNLPARNYSIFTKRVIKHRRT